MVAALRLLLAASRLDHRFLSDLQRGGVTDRWGAVRGVGGQLGLTHRLYTSIHMNILN